MDRPFEPKDIARDWSDEEILALKPGVSPALWNRFAHLEHVPGARELMQRFSFLHDGRFCTGYQPHPAQLSPFDAIRQALDDRKAGVYRVQHPKTGGTALFPLVKRHASKEQTLKAEQSWEVRARRMHDQQTFVEMDITAPRGYRIRQRGETGVLKYEDYAKQLEAEKTETKFQRIRREQQEDHASTPKLTRGD